jgi:hypothetical protein
VAIKILKVTDHFKDKYIEWVLNKDKRFKNRADLTYTDLIATGILKSLATFRKNLILIFEDSKDFTLDLNTVKLRNK